MRVIAGEAKGRKLAPPKSRAVRPTSDRVREAIFDVLSHLDVVDDATVVDLYAGSGALGIEALSRGARSATFVDSDPEALAVIEENLERTGFKASSDVVRADSIAWSRRGRGVDVAFVDPPYAFDDWDALLSVLPADLAVLESRGEVDLRSPWSLHRRYRHGGTLVTVAVKSPLVPLAGPEEGR
ncbi:MAG: 16S rRNA (guanine(966)-N(2))-methyltransferase RsmD [Acidimicrobiales bacterium]